MKKCFVKGVFKTVLLFALFLLALSSCNDVATEKNDPQDDLISGKDSVFAYNLNGVSHYVYDEAGRIVEIYTLDPITLNPYLEGTGSEPCLYSYNDKGILEGIYYFGKVFVATEFDANGRAVKAVCNDEESHLYVELYYNSSGFIANEKFYEDGTLVLHNSFDSKARPTVTTYADFGSLKFDYYDKETYVTVSSKEDPSSEMSIVIYLSDTYMPNYCMQTMDTTVVRTTWTLNEDGNCVDTLVESTSDGYSLTEKYEIFYLEDGSMSNVKYYVPDDDGSPRLSLDTQYAYTAEGKFTSQTETKYDPEGALQSVTVYDYSQPYSEKITVEHYENGEKIKTDISSVTNNSRGQLLFTERYEILPDGSYSTAARTEANYNDDGTLKIRKTYVYDEAKELKSYLTAFYTYDSYGNVIKVEYNEYDSADSLMRREIDEFTYEGNNAITTVVSMYDAEGNLLSKTVTDKEFDASGNETSSTATTYDSEGNVVESK